MILKLGVTYVCALMEQISRTWSNTTAWPEL
jgi:hypothetical protein